MFKKKWYLFAFILCVHISCMPSVENEIKHRLIHNNDGTDALGNLWFHQRPLSLNDVNAYVDMVSNSQVTTFMMCTGSDFFYYRSKYGRVIGDDNDGELNCGDDSITARNLKRYYENHLNLEKEGTDIISASLNRAKSNGMEAFITYRMNDLHFNDTSAGCPIMYSDFWYNHPEYWTNDDTPGWNGSRALDFAHQEVRDHKLAIISEQLEKYDMIDGIDLDFMRFIVYFKNGEGRKNAPLMTKLVKDIKAKVDEISEERGHKILLSVRVPITVKDCLDKGLDINEWIQLGLIDFVSLGVHWRGNPSIPVDKFKKDLGNNNIPIYATIDDGGYNPRETFSHGMIRGMASHILAQGGDGIYLFNQYYSEFNSKNNGQVALEDGDQVTRTISPSLLQELGSLNTLKRRNKIYCLSDGNSEYGIRQVSPLPLKVTSGNISVADIYIGDDPKEEVPEEVILFIRTNKPVEFEVQVNSIDVTKEMPDYALLYDRSRGLVSKDQQLAFVIPIESMNKGYNKISFKSDESSFDVKRIEIALKYGDVETNGYF